ncbi:hypothetical protein P186_2471 [Pyrobaculum ferrireducens]|uniref:Uncharacterized protein n=1 Tax=Pyrobaculum ferrireducens TaxID=1104324 RepID=G7VCQ2_9CREN|nr:hypothetical protein P186_2471 [Pyrobaculum ferrireducens]
MGAFNRIRIFVKELYMESRAPPVLDRLDAGGLAQFSCL